MTADFILSTLPGVIILSHYNEVSLQAKEKESKNWQLITIFCLMEMEMEMKIKTSTPWHFVLQLQK
jgi:hypothetical protein